MKQVEIWQSWCVHAFEVHMSLDRFWIWILYENPDLTPWATFLETISFSYFPFGLGVNNAFAPLVLQISDALVIVDVMQIFCSP